MPFKLFQHTRSASTKCPHCHEDIRDHEVTLVFGDHLFHRNCLIRTIIGPTHSRDPEINTQKNADAAVSARHSASKIRIT